MSLALSYTLVSQGIALQCHNSCPQCHHNFSHSTKSMKSCCGQEREPSKKISQKKLTYKKTNHCHGIACHCDDQLDHIHAIQESSPQWLIFQLSHKTDSSNLLHITFPDDQGSNTKARVVFSFQKINPHSDLKSSLFLTQQVFRI